MAKKKQSKKTPKKLVPEAPAPSTQTANPEDDVMYKLLDSKIEIPLGLLRQKHIFIATPCYGGQIGEPYF